MTHFLHLSRGNLSPILKNCLFLALLLPFSFVSCITDYNDNQFYPTDVNMKPVYATAKDYLISGDATRTEAKKPIQIYIQGRRIYVVDESEGFFVYDNSDSANPILLGFVACPGITNVSIKQGVLYANNFSDLVTIDVSNVRTPKETSRVKGVFTSFLKKDYPANFNGYFECVDPTKGIVLRWDTAKVENPQCRR